MHDTCSAAIACCYSSFNVQFAQIQMHADGHFPRKGCLIRLAVLRHFASEEVNTRLAARVSVNTDRSRLLLEIIQRTYQLVESIGEDSDGKGGDFVRQSSKNSMTLRDWRIVLDHEG